MQPEEYAKIAGELFQNGYNCCQAVAAAFAASDIRYLASEQIRSQRIGFRL